MEFVPIATFKYDAATEGTLTAGSKWEDMIYLERNQVAEITTMEIFAPVTPDGKYLNLQRVIPYIDGVFLEQYINLPGKYDLLITPPWNGVVRWRFEFGEPRQRHPLRSTTLKVARRLGVRVFAGEDINVDFMIRFWGVLYEEEETIVDVFGERLYGEGFEITVTEDVRNKTLTFTKPEVEVSLKNFDRLAGGVNQAPPKIMPFVTYAVNAKATTPNKPYEFKSEDGYVAEDWMNMYWNLDEDEAVVLKGIGVRAVDNLKGLGVIIGTSEFPRDFYPADPDTNKWHFGLADVQGYSTANWFGIPRLEFGGFLIHDEIGRVAVIDNGTSIPANTIHVACYGIRISELGGGRR